MNTTIADRIRALRTESGLSQKDVADKLNISRVTFLKYENGEIEPSRRLYDLARLFHVSETYLLTGKEDEPAAKAEQATPAITLKEQNLLLMLRELPESKRRLVEQTVKALAESSAPSKEKIEQDTEMSS